LLSTGKVAKTSPDTGLIEAKVFLRDVAIAAKIHLPNGRTNSPQHGIAG